MKKISVWKTSLIIFVSLTLLTACSEDFLTPPPPVTSSTPFLPPTPVATQITESPTEEKPYFLEERFPEADLALSFGDYQEALKLYRIAPPSNTEAYQAAALYGQALSHYKNGDLSFAKEVIKQLIAAYPQTIQSGRAHFLLAQIDLREGEPTLALENYLIYAENRPAVIDSYLYTIIGNLYTDQAQPEQALNAYMQAYLADSITENVEAARSVAFLYESEGKLPSALDIYNQILLTSNSDYVKAQMSLLAGRNLLRQDKQNEAYQFFQTAVKNYPYTYDAFSALQELLLAGQMVDDLDQGLIYYYRGDYLTSIEAFDQHLENTALPLDQALYYKALASRAYGLTLAGLYSTERLEQNAAGGTEQDKQAISLWAQLIEDYPQSAYRLDAIEDIIYTQNTYMGQIKLAIQTALDYIALPYSENYAPTLLYTVGNYYLLNKQPDLAAEVWSRIGIEYPNSTDAFRGLFFAGTLFYQLGDWQKAADSFNRALLIGSETLEIPGTYFWLGKVSEASGDRTSALRNWQTASEMDPFGYYGIRSAELINNKEVFSPIENANFNLDFENERITAAEWLRNSFSLPPNTNLDYEEALFSDSRFIRAIEFDRLGLFDQASAEFESLRLDYSADVLNTFRLVKVFLDYGYYQSAIEASKTITRLAGYGSNPANINLPPYFAYVEYGPYFLPWVTDRADQFGLSEALILSIIHQESRFNGHALSSAGASGLMQLMPETARQIATETGFLPNFETQDLEIPFYNLYLGSNYLARQFIVFENDPYSAVAAYNAGPGNVMTWKSLSGSDPDVFLNTIRYQETRTYLRRIVEIYHMYQLIYGN